MWLELQTVLKGNSECSLERSHFVKIRGRCKGRCRTYIENFIILVQWREKHWCQPSLSQPKQPLTFPFFFFSHLKFVVIFNFEGPHQLLSCLLMTYMTNKVLCQAPAERSQHANSTYRNIVGRSMLCAFGHRVAMCCDISVARCWLKFEMVKFEPTTPNTSQQGGQTHPTCYAQQCCDLLRWHVEIVWPARV